MIRAYPQELILPLPTFGQKLYKGRFGFGIPPAFAPPILPMRKGGVVKKKKKASRK